MFAHLEHEDWIFLRNHKALPKAKAGRRKFHEEEFTRMRKQLFLGERTLRLEADALQRGWGRRGSPAARGLQLLRPRCPGMMGSAVQGHLEAHPQGWKGGHRGEYRRTPGPALAGLDKEAASRPFRPLLPPPPPPPPAMALPQTPPGKLPRFM